MKFFFFFKKLPFPHWILGWVTIFFFAAFGGEVFFFTPQVSEVFLVSMVGEVFFFQKTSMPPLDIKWCAPKCTYCIILCTVDLASFLLQPITLALLRSDYMLHSETKNGPEIKQVEINTMASSLAGLSAKTTKLHR